MTRNPPSSRYFWELTQPEIAAQFKRHPLVILPAGSVEQHCRRMADIRWRQKGQAGGGRREGGS